LHFQHRVERKNPAPQRGFTLVELLVVVAIIGILATVALTEFAHYKQEAVDTDMVASLHSARHAMEGYYVGVLSYAGATEADLLTYGYRASPDISLKIVSATGDNYVVRVCAVGGTSPAFVYDTNVGHDQPDSGSCA
jgi:type IV pilus assembly protein PilE